MSMLKNKISKLKNLMQNCTLCPRNCKINRLCGKRGFCNSSYPAKIFYHNLLYGEEIETSPTYEIFFTGCNMRCKACYVKEKINNKSSKKYNNNNFLNKSKAISFIGGEPTVNLLSIFEFIDNHEQLPLLVFNSNMYMNLFVPDILDGIIDLYIANIKFYSDICSKKEADTKNYFQYASNALKKASQYSNVIIRYLIIPGHIECCFIPLTKWLCENLKHIPFHIMDNFYSFDKLRPTQDEIFFAKEYAEKIGLNCYKNSMPKTFLKKNIKSETDYEEEIIIEPDGKISIQHLTSDLLDVALSIDPDNKNLKLRKELFF